jgi:hypothetical protein
MRFSATTAISDPLDEKDNGARAESSVPSCWSEPSATVVDVTIPPATSRLPNAR